MAAPFFTSVLAVPSSAKWGEPHAREDPPAPVASISAEAAPQRFIGLLACDPDTVTEAYLPPHPRSRPTNEAGKPLTRIDLRTTTAAALRASAAASAPPPQPKAPAPPVPTGRLGLTTGSAPKRRRYGKGRGGGGGGGGDDDREASPSAAPKRGGGGGGAGGAATRNRGAAVPNLGRAPDADARLAEFLAGAAPEAPWESLGVLKSPVIGGTPLDLRLLWNLVAGNGGYQETVNRKGWARVAQDMGHDCRVITNAGWLVRHHYLRFLMPYEVELRRAGRFSNAVAPPPPPGGEGGGA